MFSIYIKEHFYIFIAHSNIVKGSAALDLVYYRFFCSSATMKFLLTLVHICQNYCKNPCAAMPSLIVACPCKIR